MISHLWSIYVWDNRSQVLSLALSGLSKRDAYRHWRLWKECNTGRVLIPWPDSLPALPVIASAAYCSEHRPKQGYVFELEYIDCQTGETAFKRIEGIDLARQTAKALAMASGRRAIVRRSPPLQLSKRWTVYVVDCEQGTVDLAWSCLSKREVRLRCQLWNSRRTNCALVAFPEWMAVGVQHRATSNCQSLATAIA